jgi:MFS family permease
MSKSELRPTILLSLILSFRMLGLFMILPVFSLYAGRLQGTTPTLIGVALGIYGLTQALLQMPLGMLSDKLGRKSIIVTGLIVFALGSVVAAKSYSIWGVIIGRAIQGAGAIGSTVIAFLADLTKPQNRTKAMAISGMTIGFAFFIAMIIGPLLNHWIEVSGIFWVTAGLALLGILLLIFIPHAPKPTIHSDVEPKQKYFKNILFNSDLACLNLSIGILHAILTACFVVIPFLLTHSLGLRSNQQWLFYLIVLLFAFLLIIPAIIRAEKHQQMRFFLLLAISALVISPVLFWLFRMSLLGFFIALLMFFTGFTFLESCLPSLVTKLAPQQARGTAMGIYSTNQYAGIFLGGVLGGSIYQHFGALGVFGLSSILALVWLIIIYRGLRTLH